VLFDEMEKAHADVFNVLLQVMDDGRLTDGHGRTVDFKNTVIIMTSNVGSQWINQPDLEYEEMRQRVMEVMQASFRPEFLNRVDEALIFHQLSREHLHQIVNIQLRGLQKRLAERHIELELTEPAKELLIEAGYDPAYGARPLKRTIQQKILDPLAMQVLAGQFQDGEIVLVDVDGGELVFQPGVLAEAAA
jgi:ATP-dependent Clp protease ATP-binding subunit ClpB